MLVGKSITLRTVRECDLPALYQMRADVRNLGEYYPIHLVSEMLDQKRFSEGGWWEPEFGVLLMVDDADHILGQVNFYKASPVMNAYEIGYRVYQPENWGKGYTTEAVRLFVPFLFELKQVDRVQALILPENIGSRRVLEKCGFTFEGTLRRALFLHGQYADLALYSVLRSECPPLRAQLQANKTKARRGMGGDDG